jgi:hypothetical protein
MSMAPSRHHEGSQKSMLESLPRRRIRLHHDPHVPPHILSHLTRVIPPDRSGLWCAARMPLATFVCHSVHGMKKRRKSCADTTTRRSTKRPLFCPRGSAPPLIPSRRNKLCFLVYKSFMISIVLFCRFNKIHLHSLKMKIANFDRDQA